MKTLRIQIESDYVIHLEILIIVRWWRCNFNLDPFPDVALIFKNCIYITNSISVFHFSFLADIPLSSVRVDLLYYNTAQENNNTRSKLNATTLPAGKLDKDKKKNAGMLFMPLFFNVKKLAWENMCKKQKRLNDQSWSDQIHLKLFNLLTIFKRKTNLILLLLGVDFIQQSDSLGGGLDGG